MVVGFNSAFKGLFVSDFNKN